MPESLYQQQEYEIATLSHRPTAEELRDLRFVVVIDSTNSQKGVVGRIWEAPGSAGEPYMLVEDEQGQEELCLLHLSDDGLHLYAHSSLREAKIVVLAVSDLESRYTTEDSSDPLLITVLPLSVDISGTSDNIQGVVGITNNIADYPINIFSDGTTVYVITSAGEMVTVSSFEIKPAEGEQYRLTTIDAVELGRLIAVYSRVFTQGYEATARLLDDEPEMPEQQISIITGEVSEWPTPQPIIPLVVSWVNEGFSVQVPASLDTNRVYCVASFNKRPTNEELLELRFVTSHVVSNLTTPTVSKIVEDVQLQEGQFKLVTDGITNTQLCIVELSNDGLALYAHKPSEGNSVEVFAVSDMTGLYELAASEDPVIIGNIPLTYLSDQGQTIIAKGVVGKTIPNENASMGIFMSGPRMVGVDENDVVTQTYSFKSRPANQGSAQTFNSGAICNLLASYVKVFSTLTLANCVTINATPIATDIYFDIIEGSFAQ